ncbi:MAG: nucleoside phosphorylase [Anaerolineaceae bacterium]|nr:nucleoside phosphorylase [Anaerolineaceae bacterium]MBN2676468.1 nucleoside phosphorylase [Anaerolineaceae bacterium]
MKEYPILEFDPTRKAVLEPSEHVKKMDIPERCVICFFQDVIGDLVDTGKVAQVAESRSEMAIHPVYVLKDRPVALFHPGVGAPLAIGLLEETISRGCNKFIVCGGCGVLDKEIAVGHLIVPTSAVRDEGTSYHYQEPGREAEPHPAAVVAIRQILDAHKVPYLTGKTWTTDAFYRETPNKAAARKAEGCLTVEMEAASLFAAAAFRKVVLGQILYGGDAVIPGEWDGRGWHRRKSIREDLFWLAVEAVQKIQAD